MKKYDYIIIGAGPSGLSLAWILSQYNKRCLIIDREDSSGGCHRVRRVNGLFTEHGPRIYSSAYVHLIKLMNDMGMKFTDYFTPYNFPIASLGGESALQMKWWEIWAFIVEYWQLFWNPRRSQQMTVQQFAHTYNFTDESYDYLDRLGRLTDGAGAEKYTLFEFLELLNQNLLYQIYQPKRPNDTALFHTWNQNLLQTNLVDIWLGYDVKKLVSNLAGSRIEEIIIQDTSNNNLARVTGRNIILAMPPWHIWELLSKSSHSLKDAFGPWDQFTSYASRTKYLDYLPVIFHWDRKLTLPPIWGFPKTSWAVVFIVLSDYMTFHDSRSKCVITTCITKADTPSDRTGKTANQSTQEELVEEVYRQLGESYPILREERYTEGILSPGVYRRGGKWVTKDTAFFLTTDGFQIGFESPVVKNLFTCGPHTGDSTYHFTAMEQAVSNAAGLAGQLIPESRKRFQVGRTWTLLGILKWIIILILIIIAWVLYRTYIIQGTSQTIRKRRGHASLKGKGKRKVQ